MRQIFISLIVITFFITCSSSDEPVEFIEVATCSDGIKNGTETAIDCGGTCVACDIEVDIPAQGYDAQSSYAEYDLKWSDEFEGSEIDSEKWGYHIGTGCPNLCGWGNNEEQYFTNSTENAYIKDGNLIIKAKSDNIGGKSYSSSRLHTDNLYEFQYGRIDIRASMPSAAGTWVALFLLNKDYTINDPGAYWPSGGEIDIMEYLGEDHDDILGTGHYGRDFPNNHRFNSVHTSSVNNRSFNQDFYVFSIEWEEDKITWLLNDVIYHTMTPETTSLNGQPYPFNDEFFFNLALSVGGNLPSASPSSENFPDYLIIDYVRVYQKN